MRDVALINLLGDNHGNFKRKYSAKHINTEHATDTANAITQASHTLHRT